MLFLHVARTKLVIQRTLFFNCILYVVEKNKYRNYSLYLFYISNFIFYHVGDCRRPFGMRKAVYLCWVSIYNRSHFIDTLWCSLSVEEEKKIKLSIILFLVTNVGKLKVGFKKFNAMLNSWRRRKRGKEDFFMVSPNNDFFSKCDVIIF